MKKIRLAGAGRLYMQNILGECSGAAAVLAKRVSDLGLIFAPLPQGTTDARALRFDTGGLLSQTDALNWLFGDLCSREDGTFIVQDIWSQPSDLAARRPELETYLIEENQVYYYLPHRLLNLGMLKKLHKQVTSFNFVGFYVTMVKDLQQLHENEVATGYLEDLAHHACVVYVSAYDQESWVVWETAM